MKSGDEKREGSAFPNYQILKFNLLIIIVLIFLLTIILDNSDSKIEGGYVDISITRLFQIARALDTSLTNLIGLSEEKIFNHIIHNQNGEDFKFYYATEIDQLKELYERLLKEKDEIIKLLKEKQKK
jgi:transcriptional regulator with XRE-family HTH domain